MTQAHHSPNEREFRRGREPGQSLAIRKDTLCTGSSPGMPLDGASNSPGTTVREVLQEARASGAYSRRQCPNGQAMTAARPTTRSSPTVPCPGSLRW
ncbi:hypothetical protein GCM10018779_18670 [Streptomyces griseocarneus]|nr:hypothetical protein GCM10018779_18670 [Streptomyces griseocarneus]